MQNAVISPHALLLRAAAEAVAGWLRINRPGQWQAERDAASEWFERYERGRLEEERRKRQERRSRKGGA